MGQNTFPGFKKPSLWSKDVRQVFHFDDLQGLIPIVNTVSVHVSLAVLLVQDFFEELLTRIIKSFLFRQQGSCFYSKSIDRGFYSYL